MREFIATWFGAGEIMLTRHSRERIEAGILMIVLFSGAWLVCNLDVVVAAGELEKDCNRPPCNSLDVRRKAWQIKKLRDLGGCEYDATFYINGRRISSNRFGFDSGCPSKVTVQWRDRYHCDILFDSTPAYFQYGNGTHWGRGSGTP